MNIIHKYLDNGLEVCLCPTDFASIVSCQLVVKVGSIDEETSEGGMSHVLEHMLFKGTKNYPNPGDIASLVEKAGGEMNAYTTFDHTNYYITAPKCFVGQGAEVLLDMAQCSLLDAQELSRELEVILEEIRRGEDSPQSVASKALFSQFYRETGLEHPIIGYTEVVEGFQQEQLTAFYEKWYCPNNMIFIVTGDFDPDHMWELIQSKTASFAPRSLPERRRPMAPPPSQETCAPKVVLKRGDWQELRLQCALPAPRLDDPELYAYDVCASILGDGDSARLPTSVRDDAQLVTDVDTHCFTPRYPGGAFIMGFMGRIETAQQALALMRTELATLAHTLPSMWELQRVRNVLKAHKVRAKESVEGLGRRMAFSLLTQDKLEFEDKYMAHIEEVTPQEVSDVAKTLLTHLDKGHFTISAVVSDQDQTLQEQDVATALMAPHRPRNRGPQLVPTPSSRNEQVRHIDIPLGHGQSLNLNFRFDDRLPMVHGNFVCPRPSLDTTPGLTHLMTTMLTKGTARHSYKNFVQECEHNCTDIQGFSNRDLVGLKFECLSEHLTSSLRMATDCLHTPLFGEQEWVRTLREHREMLVARKDSAATELFKLQNNMLFTPSHPYGIPHMGTEETVAGLTHMDAQTLWAQVKGPWTLSLVGQFDLDEVVSMVQQAFQAQGPQSQSTPTHPLPDMEQYVGFQAMNREQTHMAVGMRAFPIGDPRLTCLEAATHILSGQGGRLFLDLRDKQSLAYSVSAMQSPQRLAGQFLVYIATAPHKTEQAYRGLKAHLERLATELPTEEEVNRAKSSMIGGQSIDMQYHHVQASQLALCQAYGLDFDHVLGFEERVNFVTAQGIRDVILFLMEQHPPVVSVVGPDDCWTPKDDVDRSWKL